MAFWDFFHPENKFSRALARISDALSASLLTVLCALPVLTFGSALCALYTAGVRWITAHEESTVLDYFQDFRNNWKNGCVFTLLWALLIAISLLWGVFFRRTQLTYVQIPVLAIVFFCMQLLLFVYPVSAILQPRPVLALRICLFLALKAPWYALLKLACLAGIIFLAVWLPAGVRYWLLPLLLIGGIYWVNYLFCWLFIRIIEKYLPSAKTRQAIIEKERPV